MTIIRVANGESSILTSAPFQQENELVDVLALHPSMFLAEGRHEVELVTRNLGLPDTGTVDLALVDREGQPVLVEVKLARYAEPRREVIAQIFDHVAAISAWTADDLDGASNGQLGHAVRSLVSDDQERAVRWRAITQNLQAGRIRIVFAVDEMTTSLQQVIDFVGAHSDIEVHVLVVDRIADAQGHAMYDVTVHAPKVRKTRPAPTPAPAPAAPVRPAPPAIAPGLQAVLTTLHERLPENITVTGGGRTSRTLRVAGWPAGVAYEINDGKYQTVELHLADDSLGFLAPTLKEMAKSLGSFFTDASCTFDPDFGPDRGIIRLMHKPRTEASVVARNVMTLIESTRGPITRLIKAGQTAKV